MKSQFYNTTHETDNLPSYRSQAQTQDIVIAAYFRIAGALSPSEVEMIAIGDGYRWPLTSIRRSINTLTPSTLTKTKLKREGSFGRPEHIWKLKEVE